MKNVSRFSRITPALAVVVMTVPLVALALEDTVTPIANNILKTVSVLSTVVFVLAVVAFGWGIVQFIFAAGDPTNLAKAKQFLLWGVIGMAVMASIAGLTKFLQTYFGVEGGSNVIIVPKVDK